MTTHSFRTAIESGANREKLAELLSPDVTFQPPMLSKSIQDASLMADMISYAAKITGIPEHIMEFSNGPRTLMVWNGKIDGYKMQGATVLTDDKNGLIHDIAVLMRPWPVVERFRNAMFKQFSGRIPAECWEAGGKRESQGSSDTISPTVRFAPLEYAEDAAFHSPMLSKTLTGGGKISNTLKVVYSNLKDLGNEFLFATRKQTVELFKASIESYPLDGLNIRELDDQGKISSITVMLRPWPNVSVLRARTIAENIPFLTNDYWVLPQLNIA